MANFTAETNNIIKPHVTDSVKQKTLSLSGGYHYNRNGYNQKVNSGVDYLFTNHLKEEVKLYSATLYRAVVTDRMYYTYGGYLDKGTYTTNVLTGTDEGYDFNGAGFIGEIGGNKVAHRGHVNLKYGVKAIVKYETGEFTEFRKRVDTTIVTIGNGWFENSAVDSGVDPWGFNLSWNMDLSVKVKDHVFGTFGNTGFSEDNLTLGCGWYYSYQIISVFYSLGYYINRNAPHEGTDTNYYRSFGVSISLLNK
ncbi:MAG: hypothetical protein OCD76_13710 [Reichenbachiella sp.]